MENILKTIVSESNDLFSKGRLSEAIITLENIAVEVLSLLSIGYGSFCADYNKSIKYIELAQSIEPRNWILHANKAHMLNMLIRFDEAKEECRKSIENCEVQADLYYNYGVILSNLMDIDNAIIMYRKALSIEYKPIISHNLGAMLLTKGEYDEGWKLYEDRFRVFKFLQDIKDRFDKHWDGSDISGKTLYIYNEQGIGDLIQFIRFLPNIAKNNVKIIVECQRELESLLEENKDNLGIFQVIGRDGLKWPNPLPDHDLAISICSIPMLLNIHPEKPIVPYIKIPDKPFPEDWDKNKLNIGFVWAGNCIHDNDYVRSCSVKHFAKLAELPHVQLFSLQKGSPETRKWLGNYVNLYDGINDFSFIDLDSKIKDFLDTTYYLSHLDLVVTVDTAIAHLAGAMNKPVFNLLGYTSDWRWSKDSNTTIWYSSMKLIRQKQHYNDWSETISRVYEYIMRLNPKPPH